MGTHLTFGKENMPYSIEIRFDRKTESNILSIWQDAARFYGSDYVLKNGVIPHIALLVGDSCLESLFSQVEIHSDLIRLSGISFFGDGSVSYLRAEAPQSIIDLQELMYRLAVESGSIIDPYYSPENWIPHCTIAQNCTSNQKQVLGRYSLEARVKSLILIQYPPTTLLAERSAVHEQGIAPNRSLAPTLNSTSPLRDSEDS